MVLRATWPEDTITAKALLALYRAGRPHLTDKEIDRIETFKRDDLPPEDKWAGQ